MGHRFWVGSLLSLLALALPVAPAWAGDPGKAVQPAAGGPDLDQLLKLPSSVEYSTEKRGGATRSEWRQRFHDARIAVANAEAALKKAQDDLANAAGEKDDWQFTPPGIPQSDSSTDTTGSYQLRQEVKKQHGEVQRSAARLREIEIQANLAGVPDDWRDPSTQASSSHDLGTQPPAAH